MKRFPTLIALLAVSAAGMAQSITLRLNLPVGKSYAYAVTTKIKSEGGMAVANGSVSQTMTTTQKVLSKNVQGTRIQTKITGVKMTTDGKGMMAQQMSQAAKQLEGSVTESVFDSRAQVVTASEGPRVTTMGGMGVGFLGVLYPSGPVAPGGTWRSEVDFQKIFSAMGQGMIQTGKNKTVPIRFKLVRVQRLGARTLAHLSYEMKGNLDLTVGAGGQGQTMPMKVNVDMKGQFVVDTAIGLPREGKSGGTTKVLISGMTILQTINSTYRLK